MKNEIILYRPDELAKHIEVKIDEATVWLSLNQIADLFKRDKSVISRHIKNIFNENELSQNSVVANFATTAADGKIYQVEHYNLDVIISVGYRVKSHQGTQFRIWATNVLRDYLLKGYALNNRINRIEDNVYELKQKVQEIDFHISTKLLPTQGIFFDGQIFDAYKLVSEIIRSARQSIVLIDNYIDETTLTILSKKELNTKVLLLTKSINKQLNLDVEKANQQYRNFTLREFNKSHDRFLIIDETEIYHFGASLKDLGRKWFAFSKMDKSSVESILKAI